MSRALLMIALVASVVLPACSGKPDEPSTGPDASAQAGSSLTSPLGLDLVAEKKLSKLFSEKTIEHYEASGVVASGGTLYVASDNTTRIGRIDTSLNDGVLGPGDNRESQYEAITATDDGRFYAMVESASADDPRAKVVELSSSGAVSSEAFTDVSFDHPNKGFEGVAWLRVEDTEYLLALCENNDCKDDDSAPGKGRLKRLSLVNGVWATQGTFKLPSGVAFLNFSDLALNRNQDGTFALAVVSHKSSALWRGTLSAPSGAGSAWAVTGPGTFYAFPRAPDGAIQYCSVEGVTFLGPSVFAVVSDKSDGSANCSDEEESVHIFQTPR